MDFFFGFQGYVEHLLGKAVGDICGLAARSDLASLANRPDVMAHTCLLLEILRGATTNIVPRAQSIIFKLLVSTFSVSTFQSLMNSSCCLQLL